MRRYPNCTTTLLPALAATLLMLGIAGCGGSNGNDLLPPSLHLSTTRLDFTATQTQQALTLENNGGGLLSWSASTNTPWIAIQETRATTATITVTVDREGLAAGTHEGSIAITSSGGDATVPVTMVVAAQQIILDNLNAGFSIVSGNWGTAGTADGNGSYGPDFRYHLADRVNIARARFTPNLAGQAPYEVSIYWSAAPNRTTAQPVVVHNADGTDSTYQVNLQQHGHQWFRLGTHTLGPGSYVEFNTDTDAGYCNADAVRLVR